jgi:GAF domain-containing protein
MAPSSDFAESIAEAARTLNKPRGLEDTLQTIVEVASSAVPGFDHVGISTLAGTGDIETRAFTSELVPHLDEVQYALREGPCSAVLQGDDAVAVSRLQDEERWPQYVPQAREVGVRSQVAVKLYLDSETLGGINFYSTTDDAVSQDALAAARLFAAHAAIALGHAQERESFAEGLQTRRVIGQALGILMERYAMDEDRAFAVLVRASSHANMRLRAVAQGLVDDANAKVSQNLSSMSPGGERRALVREIALGLSLDGVTPAQWAAIEAEAPGIRALLESILGEPMVPDASTD